MHGTAEEELKGFLRLVNYLAKFIPNMSQLDTPLRVLLKKELKKDRLDIERRIRKVF